MKRTFDHFEMLRCRETDAYNQPNIALTARFSVLEVQSGISRFIGNGYFSLDLDDFLSDFESGLSLSESASSGIPYRGKCR